MPATYKYDEPISGGFLTAAQDGDVTTAFPLLGAQTPDAYARTHSRSLYQRKATYATRLAERTSCTNLFTYSELFSNAAWTKGNLTQNSATATGPDGRPVAFEYAPSSSDAYLQRGFTPASVTAHHFSVWLRSVSGSVVLTLRAVRSSDNARAREAEITVTTTWQRFGLVFSPIDTTSHNVIIGGFSSWSTGEVLQVAHAQLEAVLVAASPLAATEVNLLNFPTTFSDGRWLKGTLTEVSSTAVDPDGGSTAFEYLTTSADSYLQQSFLSGLVVEHTFSIWLRSVTGTIPLTIHATRVSASAIVASTAVTLTTTWQQFTLAFTPLDATAHNVVVGGFSTLGTGLSFRVAEARLSLAVAPGPYIQTLAAARTVTAPDIDEDDPFAYLAAESSPAPTGIGDLVRFDRTFARIPGQQVTRDYQSFARPNCSGLKSGSTYAASLDGGNSFHLWTSLKSVTGSTTSQGSSNSNSLPSGNVTVTDTLANSVTFAANASQATILAALAPLKGSDPNGLSNFSVYTNGTDLTITWFRWIGGPNIASVVPPTGATVAMVGNMAQIKAFGTTITPDTKLILCPSHGATVGMACAVWNGDVLVATGSVSGVTDSNYLALVLSDLSSPDFNITGLSFSAAATVRYAVGERPVRIKVTRDFFLPGVTMLADGTTMPDLDSIPDVTTYTAPQSWLDRIVAGATYVNIKANEVGQYLGPIAYRDTVSVRLADALESLSLT